MCQRDLASLDQPYEGPIDRPMKPLEHHGNMVPSSLRGASNCALLLGWVDFPLFLSDRLRTHDKSYVPMLIKEPYNPFDLG